MIANILFQDTRFVVLDKPPGLPAHPVRQGGPSLEDCFPHISRRKDGPWLVHRLDRDTSGCLLVALRKAALIAAQAEFAAGRVRKTFGRSCAAARRRTAVRSPLRSAAKPKKPPGAWWWTRWGSPPAPRGRSWGAAPASPGWNCARAVGGRINCGCIAPPWGFPFWGTRFMAMGLACCTCWPANWSWIWPRQCAPSRHRRRICSRLCCSAAGAGFM